MIIIYSNFISIKYVTTLSFRNYIVEFHEINSIQYYSRFDLKLFSYNYTLYVCQHNIIL